MREKMFEVATRTKMRFPFKGLVSTEDVWELPLKDLDLIFKKLNSQIKQEQEESLMEIKSKEDKILDMQIEIVKYIFETKTREENSRLQAKEKKDKKQKILSLLSEKQEEDLRSKSSEELQKILDEL